MRFRQSIHDRPEFGRRMTNRRAWIVVDGRRVEPCLVKNITAEGATIICEHLADLAFVFEIVLEPDQSTLYCQLGGITEAGAGVTFVAPDDDFAGAQDAGREQLEEWAGDTSGPASLPDPDRFAWLEPFRQRRSGLEFFVRRALGA